MTVINQSWRAAFARLLLLAAILVCFPIVTNQIDSLKAENSDPPPVIASIPLPQALPNTLGGMAINPQTNRLYVLQAAGLTIIDTTTNKLLTTLPVKGSVIAINPMTNRLYILSSGSNNSSITVLDGSSNTVIATISENLGTLPDSLAVNPTTNRLYISDIYGYAVIVIDGNTNKVVKQIPVGRRPSQIVINPKTNLLYVTTAGYIDVIDGNSDTYSGRLDLPVFSLDINTQTNRLFIATNSQITIFDIATNRVIKTLQTGNIPLVTINSATNRAYFVNGQVGNVSTIDGNTNTVIDSFTLKKEIRAPIINPLTNRLYILEDNSVKVIDATIPNTAFGIAKIKTGNQPDGLAANFTNNRLYVANRRDGTISVINSTTNQVITTTPVGNIEQGIALNVNQTTNRVYAVTPGTVFVLDGTTNQVITRVTNGLGSNSNNVAVNSATNKIYITNQGSGDVSVLDGVTNTITATIKVGPNPVGIGLNSATNRLFVSYNDRVGKVVAIDINTNQIVDSTELLYNAGLLVANPGANRVFVVEGSDIRDLNGSNFNSWNNIFIGFNPGGLAINPTTGRIYAVNSTVRNAWVVDSTTGTSVTSLPTEATPAAIAVNPLTNLIYIANRDSNTITVYASDISGAPTFPSGVIASNPNPIEPGKRALITVKVTPGTNPVSSRLFVVVDLSSLGDSSYAIFSDDGQNGDEQAGDNIFSYRLDVAPDVSPGEKKLFSVIDDQQRRTVYPDFRLTVGQTSSPPVCRHPSLSQLSDYRLLNNAAGQPDSANGLSKLVDSSPPGDGTSDGTFWRWTNYPKAVALQVNLGTVQTVSQLKLFTLVTGKAPVTYFQYSQDGKSWSDIPSLANVNTGADYGSKAYPANVVAQYIRLVIDNTTYLYDVGYFADLQVCASSGGSPTPPQPSSTPHRLPIASVSASAGNSQAVLDGIPWTDWFVDNRPASAQLTLDLGSEQKVSGLTWFATLTAVAKQTTIEYSSDGTNWTALPGATNINTAPSYGLNTAGPFTPVMTRYIRFRIDNAAGDWALGGYGEIDILG